MVISFLPLRALIKNLACFSFQSTSKAPFGDLWVALLDQSAELVDVYEMWRDWHYTGSLHSFPSPPLHSEPIYLFDFLLKCTNPRKARSAQELDLQEMFFSHSTDRKRSWWQKRSSSLRFARLYLIYDLSHLLKRVARRLLVLGQSGMRSCAPAKRKGNQLLGTRLYPLAHSVINWEDSLLFRIFMKKLCIWI